MVALITQQKFCIFIAFLLFCVAGFIRFNKKAYDTGCIALGFAFLTLAILVTGFITL